MKGQPADRLQIPVSDSSSAAPRLGTGDEARKHALEGFRAERSDTLGWLQRAFARHLEESDHAAASVDTHVALTYCLVDIGAMDQVKGWLERSEGRGTPAIAGERFWAEVGCVARAVLGEDMPTEAAASVTWTIEQLQPLQDKLGPDERLIAAQVLLNYYLAEGRPEMFDVLATSVGGGPAWAEATALMKARWLCALGYAHYQIGNHEHAEATWTRSIACCREAGLSHTEFLASVALLRLMIDRGRLDEARSLEASIDPEWGAGRNSQLVTLKQMSAQLQLLGGFPVRAFSTLKEALAIAAQAGLSAAELASCSTDHAQYLICNERIPDAVSLLEELVSQHHGRDREVFHCLLELLHAWRGGEERQRRDRLVSGLRRAQEIRYSMFFRLVPWLAADICALALRLGIEGTFVGEVVRVRQLPAPLDADEHWPWAVWLRMLGTFELRLRGRTDERRGKVQHKPLELLRAIACNRGLVLGAQAASDALWPDADADLAYKSLESTILRLRRLLGDDSLVRLQDGRVSLDPMRVSSDVIQRRILIKRLERAMIPAREPVAAEAHAARCELAARVSALSLGELLPGAPSSPWLEYERRQCEAEEARMQQLTAILESVGRTPNLSARQQPGGL